MKPLKGKRVFVVEDEAIIAAMVEDMLMELGAAVIGPAYTMKSGLALANADGIDAAVLDVNIRSERVDAIARVLEARHIPVVFATGYGTSPAGARNGFVIEKPYTLEKLATALAFAFSKHNANVPPIGGEVEN